MRRLTLFKMDIPYREPLRVTGLEFGVSHGTPTAAIVGSTRGDEVQQAFVPGRSCEFRDMCIDAAGVLLGAAFLLLILHLIQRKKLKR